MAKDSQRGVVCETHEEECIAKDKGNNNEILFKAPVKDGLYVVCVKRRVCAATVNKESGSSVKNAVALRSVAEWHSKLGHLHSDAIKKIPVIGCIGKLDEKCDVCEKGKATKLGFPQTSDRQSCHPLDLIHTDVMGKLTNSLGGSKYVITFIGDYSRFVRVYYLKKKSEAFKAFKQYQTYVEVLHERKIKAMQSDGGGEYIDGEFQAYLRERGVVHRKTVKNSPEQNGISERQNRTLANIVRCLLIQSGLPKTFWAEAFNVAVYVRNLSPSRAICNRIPVELWSNAPVTADMYERLIVLGCKGWLYEKGDKFDKMAIDYIFVGYGDVENVKGYKVWCPTKGKFVIAHNVKFDQTVFPYVDKYKLNTEWVVPTVSDNTLQVQVEYENTGNDMEDDFNMGLDDEFFNEEDDVIEEMGGEIDFHNVHPEAFEDCLELHVEPAVEPEVALRRLQKIEWLKSMLSHLLEVRDLMSDFLSMNIVQEEGKISVDQRKYIQDILSEFKLDQANGRSAPLPVSNDDQTETGNEDFDRSQYQHAVGKLVYLLGCTRPDLSFALSKISQCNNAPKKGNWNDVHVLRYVKETKDLRIVYSKDNSKPKLETYCDSDYNNTKKERVSFSGYVIMMSNGPIVWKTKKQEVTA
ncbi:hypothetical protein ONE63_005180 [Megalurothrips usitatus]|uniref:Integrase catalytic domain-containing protein n=1 Tax=Megalurothrips usitatus TaxID=439358 RepID=A0AAV7XUM8_9NEOP|nr:hypothetical protein ONE63_005180 [Megalurothrips usitatus]